MSSDVAEAKAAVEKMQHDLAAQKAKWPKVHAVAKALYDVLEENHFTERLRIAQEGRGDHH